MSIEQHTSLLVQNGTYIGQVSRILGDVLHGWVVNRLSPNARVIVEVLIDGVQVKTGHANQFNADAMIGDYFNGFLIALSKEWLHHARQVSVRVANTDYVIPGIAHANACMSEVSHTESTQIWYTGGLRVEGRLYRREIDLPIAKFSLWERDKFIDNVEIGPTGCGFLDLPKSYQRFEIDLPWSFADGAVHTVDIRDDSGCSLAGSPIKVICWPQGVERFLQKELITDPKRLISTIAGLARLSPAFNGSSISFKYYDHWFKLFSAAGQQLTKIDPLRIGILILCDYPNDNSGISIGEVTDSNVNIIAEQGWKSDIIPAIERLIAKKCQVVIPIKAGDRLADNAIPLLCDALQDGAAWAFGDCDQDGPEGERCSPWLKPEWNVNLFLGADVFSHGAIFTSAIIEQALKTCQRQDSNKASWIQLLAGIALATETKQRRVRRITRIVYHRKFDSSLTLENKISLSTRKAAMAWLSDNIAPGATIAEVSGHSTLLRVIWPLNDSLPRVTVIVPTRDRVDLLRQCVEGLIHKTDYPNIEIIIVDNQSTSAAALDYMETLKASNVKVIKYDKDFNYAALNNQAAKIATGELLLFLNNDTTVIHESWLTDMVREFRPNVGVVGAKLLWHNGMVQHAGVTVGIDGLVAHIGNKWSESDAGYLGFNQLARKLSAVTGACMMTRKSIYETLGGMDHEAFPVSLNDIDYCLRVQNLGFDVVWTPFAKMLHAESASRGKDDTTEKRARAIREQTTFMDRWASGGLADKYYHPFLSQDYKTGPYGGLVIPPTY